MSFEPGHMDRRFQHPGQPRSPAHAGLNNGIPQVRRTKRRMAANEKTSHPFHMATWAKGVLPSTEKESGLIDRVTAIAECPVRSCLRRGG